MVQVASHFHCNSSQFQLTQRFWGEGFYFLVSLRSESGSVYYSAPLRYIFPKWFRLWIGLASPVAMHPIQTVLIQWNIIRKQVCINPIGIRLGQPIVCEPYFNEVVRVKMIPFCSTPSFPSFRRRLIPPQINAMQARHVVWVKLPSNLLKFDFFLKTKRALSPQKIVGPVANRSEALHAVIRRSDQYAAIGGPCCGEYVDV